MAPVPDDSAVVDRVVALLSQGLEFDYIGEGVTQLAHALQAAHAARLRGCGDLVVVAALLHDIGHLLGAEQEVKGGAPVGRMVGADGTFVGMRGHERLAADFLRAHGFGEAIAELVLGHTSAKRYLCSADPSYYDRLSGASKRAHPLVAAGRPFTHAAFAHCETTSGVLNDAEALGAAAAAAGAGVIIDAMSSFGAVPLDLAAARADFVVSSANKCLQGVPGFSFVVARRAALAALAGRPGRSVSLDLHAQWAGLEAAAGQFRFTPPTHALLAFHEALKEFEEEGGVGARGARYAENRRVLREGMARLGFEEFLAPEHQSYIITSFKFPEDPSFKFEEFYGALADRGFYIYPGKVSSADCFRVGTIGALFPGDFRRLLDAVAEVYPPAADAAAAAAAAARIAAAAVKAAVGAGAGAPAAAAKAANGAGAGAVKAAVGAGAGAPAAAAKAANGAFRAASASAAAPAAGGGVQAVVFDWAGTTIDYGSRAPLMAFLEVFR
ncbi:hypothetical protein Rsub_08317 [Raphidocelis subcapitata]|uniref:HD/PDEase domain-containing protein n=1 Tax=Raphidocelis subcapitata TaxID=307507 RepID=A0A2V0P613_9CHLO|nr:hypothetical protein Rsub_08317 [Raphidocelis subcapitata]|eukprot:GBF95286.1 hypothetical protein Rsub_08317 [Raphidocelis subcapitata]